MDFENRFYFVYVLFSETDSKHCVGYTHNLHLRFEQHNKGLLPSTKNRRPLKLIYFEASLNQQDATSREKYFKTHYGRMFIKKRLQNYYSN
jgi:putative endonuclease